jgi:lipopolysaccharide/colanic/teichoic acid biosynthesis glycosyltransferase
MNPPAKGNGTVPVARPVNFHYPTVKRIMDVLLALVVLIIFSPLMLIMAIGIKLHSTGPVFFRQVRVGKGGAPFQMLKFRTMSSDTDCSIHQNHVSRLIRENIAPLDEKNDSLKLTHHPDITTLGQLLRSNSLDELPQLFNILKGEMSLVGPRPPLPYEVELYKGWHMRRLEGFPGLTGLWQVDGRNRVSFDEMVRMDIYYLEHMGLWMDIRIILKTPYAMFFGKGAG